MTAKLNTSFLGDRISVSNMVNEHGRLVPNQFMIGTPEGLYFQSYDLIIAFRGGGKIYLDKTFWKHSPTIGKYRNLFLGETTKETQRKIDSGEYILTELNEVIEIRA